MWYQGLIEGLKAVREHATYVDGNILLVTKIDFETSHESCGDDLSACSFNTTSYDGLAR